MKPDISADDMTPVFAALANGHRREIIRALSLQPLSISQLASLRGLSLPAIHKHVRVLENAAMVQRRKTGRTNYLALEHAPLRRLATWVGQFHPWWGTESESLENSFAYLNKEPEVTEESS
jgi:DNA-binding transcriptional ArsR family regulator